MNIITKLKVAVLLASLPTLLSADVLVLDDEAMSNIVGGNTCENDCLSDEGFNCAIAPIDSVGCAVGGTQINDGEHCQIVSQHFAELCKETTNGRDECTTLESGPAQIIRIGLCKEGHCDTSLEPPVELGLCPMAAGLMCF